MSEEWVRVRRTLEYVGPREWVTQVLGRSVVTGMGTSFPLEGGKSIRDAEPEVWEVLRPALRFVQVSYVNAVGDPELESLTHERWDYIDGIGDLMVGERVVAPRINWSPRVGVVMGIGKKQDWDGPYSTITERATSG